MPTSLVTNMVRVLGGYRAGANWMAHCPAHEDNTPSLSISETTCGTILVHCHAGCSQAAVIDALRDRDLWPSSWSDGASRLRKPKTVANSPLAQDEKRRIARALQPWCEARAATGTLVTTYLRSRGITVSAPATIRYHPVLRHRSGNSVPAMIGLVASGRDNRPIGIHRTWLAHDGSAKAPIAPNKMMLGPCRGGAVRLAPASAPLLIGEGIETCLAAMQATGYATWAALSTSGMRALELPMTVRDIVILADGDPPGQTAAEAAASRWISEGRGVRIAHAPDGKDFNDLLVSGRLEKVGV